MATYSVVCSTVDCRTGGQPIHLDLPVGDEGDPMPLPTQGQCGSCGQPVPAGNITED